MVHDSSVSWLVDKSLKYEGEFGDFQIISTNVCIFDKDGLLPSFAWEIYLAT